MVILGIVFESALDLEMWRKGGMSFLFIWVLIQRANLFWILALKRFE